MKRKNSITNEILQLGRFSQLRPKRSKNWSKATLEEYLLEFLVRIEPTLHPNTYRDYSQVVRDHIIPHMGTIKLKDLNQDHIQSLHSCKLKNGTTPTRVRFIHKILSRALNLAVRWRYRKDNPAESVTIPKKTRREMKTFSLEEVQVFLHSVKGMRLEALFHLAVTSGLRQSELLGLMWSDLDWDTGNLRIQRQLQRVRGQGLVFSDPKSSSGRRLVVLGPSTLEKLQKHKDRQELETHAVIEKWQAQNLIFAKPDGSPIGPRDLYRRFKTIINDAELPDIRFHDLRHTAATLMLQCGVHPKVVQERLGHSSISITLDLYSHISPAMQYEAAMKIDELIHNKTSRFPL